jgi:hypothetical protein
MQTLINANFDFIVSENDQNVFGHRTENVRYFKGTFVNFDLQICQIDISKLIEQQF